MELVDIREYLLNFNKKELNKEIPEKLKKIKGELVCENKQEEAKDVWCMEEVYTIINYYLEAYNCLQSKEYYDAWSNFDNADIHFTFLRKHFDYKDKHNLLFIEKEINNYKKLFPYKEFISREEVIKLEHCSICGQKRRIRKPCGHKVGEIYNGEMCGNVVDDREIIGVAVVENPFDKYAVVMPENREYNYEMLEKLVRNLSGPFQEWDIDTEKKILEKFKGKGRNDLCPCNSGKKYKKCCLGTEKERYLHYIVTIKDSCITFEMTEKFINIWK